MAARTKAPGYVDAVTWVLYVRGEATQMTVYPTTRRMKHDCGAWWPQQVKRGIATVEMRFVAPTRRARARTKGAPRG